VGISFDALEVLTGRSYSKIAPFKENFPVHDPKPNDKQAWVEMALKNNQELKAQSLTAKALKQTAQARKADHYPTVDGTISLSRTDNTQTFGNNPPFSSEDDLTSINVTLNVPIFSGFGTSSARRQANKEAIAARENFLSVLTGVATVKARKQAIVSSSSAYEATNAGYEVGTRDLVDVLNAQRAVFQAERDHDTALYSYLINALNLKAVAGILGEKDILELNAWLDEKKPAQRIN